MTRNNKAQVSVELILILAAVLMIVLISANFIVDTINDITLHLKIVIKNIRNKLLTQM